MYAKVDRGKGSGMATNRKLQIRQQLSRLTVQINEAMQQCDRALIADDIHLFHPDILPVSREANKLVNLIRDYQAWAADAVNGGN